MGLESSCSQSSQSFQALCAPWTSCTCKKGLDRQGPTLVRALQKSDFVHVAAGVKMIMGYHLWKLEGSWHYFFGFQTIVTQAFFKPTEYFPGLCKNVSSFLQNITEILSPSQVSDLFFSFFVDASSWR